METLKTGTQSQKPASAKKQRAKPSMAALTMNVAVFTGKTFVGHLGLFIREDGGLNSPVGEDWRHDLFSHLQAIEAVLETIAKGDDEGLPQGIYHVYVNATPQGKAAMNVYDCACKPQPTVSRGTAGP